MRNFSSVRARASYGAALVIFVPEDFCEGTRRQLNALHWVHGRIIIMEIAIIIIVTMIIICHDNINVGKDFLFLLLLLYAAWRQHPHWHRIIQRWSN